MENYTMQQKEKKTTRTSIPNNKTTRISQAAGNHVMQMLIDQARRGEESPLLEMLPPFKIDESQDAKHQPFFRSYVLADGTFNGIPLGLTWSHEEWGDHVHAEETILEFIDELMGVYEEPDRDKAIKDYLGFCSQFGLSTDLAQQVLGSIQETGNTLVLDISSSPCSTIQKTKTPPYTALETGCSEKITHLQRLGVDVTINFGKYYQPKHLTGAKAVSEKVCSQMEQLGITMHLDPDVIQR